MFNFLKRDDSKVINVNDMDNLIGKVEIIDIREPYEFRGGSLRTAKNIPMSNLSANPEKYIAKDKTYYIICQSGARSGMLTRIISKQGYSVINVAGGIGSYVGSKRN
ncbi:MAG: rhodanese-like domain-containing protein [Clostridiales bacterium]|jgi:rhodanese-related sulfurtransferase|nr:rhodanese-like domain-containing protein [Clostridiales bacterium]